MANTKSRKPKNPVKVSTVGVGLAVKGKASHLDKLARKRFVADLMGKGYGAESAAVELAARVKLSLSQARTYVTEVRNEWAAAEEQERPTRRAQCLRLLERGARMAIEQQDAKALATTVREMARITGLDQREVHVTGGVGALQEQIMAALAASRPGDAQESPTVDEGDHDTDD